jgi:hypothetical protein
MEYNMIDCVNPEPKHRTSLILARVVQYLYDKKLAMKLLMDEKLGGTPRKLRMERDW